MITSAWAWRHQVRAAMLHYAARDLPQGKRRRDWKAKAHAFSQCGRTVSALSCDNCQNVNTDSGTIIATCGLRICPNCARRKAQKLRHRLVRALEKSPLGAGVSLYFLTFTMRYDPSDPDEVSAVGLLRRKGELLEAWSSTWRQYLKKRAQAACRAIEVSSSGMVHLHVLYLGLRPDVEILRNRWMMHASDSPIVNVKYCAEPRKAVVELAKYVTKGASPAKLDIVSGTPAAFMDPRLAVAVEIAFSGDRMVQCYGAWLGISVDDEEDTPEEELERRELHRAPCLHCGLVGEWHTANYTLEEWFERFGDQLDHWKPRIGGQGPTKPRGDDENGDNRTGIGERERAREQLRRNPARARRGVPKWAADAPEVGGQ